MDCNTCKEKRAEPVSYIVFESTKATLERSIKRLWIIAIILIALLFATNAGWIYYESKWKNVDLSEVTQEVDTGDGSAYVAGIGDINYGEGQTNS